MLGEIVKGLDGGGLPFVTLKLDRGTTALEVKAPPVHWAELVLV